ncbi:MAG: UDP-4-amino-4,6-dideoxy-N-acetyl-beta-L-altrosamine transaminase [Cyclobacteriaceae bacterium]|nr:UDP-4-amino-4,6-dideoxy-N-acetyl-beta-L-altrosamine transaminase [Cyclobacteriaceae bacterium]
MIRPIPYGKQSISKDDELALVDALNSEFLTQGPKVYEFESKFADYVGSKYAVAVSNGTAALHLCTLALGVNYNSNVITTPITFAASANCVLYCGGKVHFADIDSSSGVIDIGSVIKLLESKPEGYFHGLIPVDFAGYPVNLEEFRKIADQYGLWIIEDACHAPGGFFTDSASKQQRCGNGNYADLAIFSFHPVKHIATGEGGMITTNDEQLYKKLLKLRTHGITKEPSLLEKNEGGWYYEMQELGFNYRIPDILCALGISQLKKAERGLSRRKEIARKYDEAFKGYKSIRKFENQQNLDRKGIQHAYHLYIIRIKDRLELYNHLRLNNIIAQVHYIPVYSMPYYRNNGYHDVRCIEAESYYSECLSLPIYPSLSDTEQNFVIETILNFINKKL